MFDLDFPSLINRMRSDESAKSEPSRPPLVALPFVDEPVGHPDLSDRTVSRLELPHGQGWEDVSDASSGVLPGTDCAQAAELIRKSKADSESGFASEDLLCNGIDCLQKAMNRLPGGMAAFVELFELCRTEVGHQKPVNHEQLTSMAKMGLRALDKIDDSPEYVDSFHALSRALIDWSAQLLGEPIGSQDWILAVRLLRKCMHNPQLELLAIAQLVEAAKSLHENEESGGAIEIIRALPRVPADLEHVVSKLWSKSIKAVAAQNGRAAIAITLDYAPVMEQLPQNDVNSFKKMVLQVCMMTVSSKSASYCNALCQLFQTLDTVQLHSVNGLLYAIRDLDDIDVPRDELTSIWEFLGSLSDLPISSGLLLSVAKKLSNSSTGELREYSASLLATGTKRAVYEGGLSRDDMESIADTVKQLVLASIGEPEAYIRDAINRVLKYAARQDSATLAKTCEGILNGLLKAVSLSSDQAERLYVMNYFVLLYDGVLSRRPNLPLSLNPHPAYLLSDLAATFPEEGLATFHRIFVAPFMHSTSWPSSRESDAIYAHFFLNCTSWINELSDSAPGSERERFFSQAVMTSLEGLDGTVAATMPLYDQDISKRLLEVIPLLIRDAIDTRDKARVRYFLRTWRNHIPESIYEKLSVLPVEEYASLDVQALVAIPADLPQAGRKRKERA